MPILVGPKPRSKPSPKSSGSTSAGHEIVDAPHSQAAAEMAVELVRKGTAELLMKGSLHSDELLGRGHQARDGAEDRTAHQPRVRHGRAQPSETLFITDAAVNIFPDLMAKRDIVQNAIDLYAGLGLGTPKVAILSAVETVNPGIPSTIEAAALCKMADRGQITGGDARRAARLRQCHQPRSSAASRASTRPLPDTRKFSSCRTSKPATCWRRT